MSDLCSYKGYEIYLNRNSNGYYCTCEKNAVFKENSGYYSKGEDAIMATRHVIDCIIMVESSPIGPSQMLQKGGKWLGEAREFLYTITLNGDSVVWGSDDIIRFKSGITVKDFEMLAATIAAAVTNELTTNK